jgi:hypothetical protein
MGVNDTGLPTALTIAGSDSGGGAGIQADLKTFAAHGVYGTSAITALTAQNTVGVEGVHVVPDDFVTAQIEAVVGDLGCDAVKTGMLANSTIVEAVAAAVESLELPNLVVDPNAGPHTIDAWISRSAFERLNVQTQAGQFGTAGRNIARGPAYTNVDMALSRDFALVRNTRLQMRAEVFNVANHANFGLPVADLNSPSFGRNLSAGQPRLMQFAAKLLF